MTDERWLDIPNYDGLYCVSDTGRVMSRRYGKSRIMRPSFDRYGYQFVALWRDKKPKHHSVHRLVATAFIPNPDGDRVVNHINAIKTDNRPVNLEWCTQAHNLRHTLAMGLRKMPAGENNRNSKLTDRAVMDARRSFAAGESSTILAARYGVSRNTMWLAVTHQTWRHLL